MNKEKKKLIKEKETKSFLLRLSISDSNFIEAQAKERACSKTEIVKRSIEKFKEGVDVESNRK